MKIIKWILIALAAIAALVFVDFMWLHLIFGKQTTITTYGKPIVLIALPFPLPMYGQMAYYYSKNADGTRQYYDKQKKFIIPVTVTTGTVGVPDVHIS